MSFFYGRYYKQKEGRQLHPWVVLQQQQPLLFRLQALMVCQSYMEGGVWKTWRPNTRSLPGLRAIGLDSQLQKLCELGWLEEEGQEVSIGSEGPFTIDQPEGRWYGLARSKKLVELLQARHKGWELLTTLYRTSWPAGNHRVSRLYKDGHGGESHTLTPRQYRSARAALIEGGFITDHQTKTRDVGGQVVKRSLAYLPTFILIEQLDEQPAEGLAETALGVAETAPGVAETAPGVAETAPGVGRNGPGGWQKRPQGVAETALYSKRKPNPVYENVYEDVDRPTDGADAPSAGVGLGKNFLKDEKLGLQQLQQSLPWLTQHLSPGEEQQLLQFYNQQARTHKPNLDKHNSIYLQAVEGMAEPDLHLAGSYVCHILTRLVQAGTVEPTAQHFNPAERDAWLVEQNLQQLPPQVQPLSRVDQSLIDDLYEEQAQSPITRLEYWSGQLHWSDDHECQARAELVWILALRPDLRQEVVRAMNTPGSRMAQDQEAQAVFNWVTAQEVPQLRQWLDQACTYLTDELVEEEDQPDPDQLEELDEEQDQLEDQPDLDLTDEMVEALVPQVDGEPLPGLDTQTLRDIAGLTPRPADPPQEQLPSRQEQEAAERSRQTPEGRAREEQVLAAYLKTRAG